MFFKIAVAFYEIRNAVRGKYRETVGWRIRNIGTKIRVMQNRITNRIEISLDPVKSRREAIRKESEKLLPELEELIMKGRRVTRIERERRDLVIKRAKSLMEEDENLRRLIRGPI